MEPAKQESEPGQTSTSWLTGKYLGGLLVGGFTGILMGPLSGVGTGLAAGLILNWLRPDPPPLTPYSSDGTIVIYLPFLVMLVMVFVGAVLGLIVGLFSATQRTSGVRVVGALIIGLGTGWLLSQGDELLWYKFLALGGACGLTAIVVENRVAAAIWRRAA